MAAGTSLAVAHGSLPPRLGLTFELVGLFNGDESRALSVTTSCAMDFMRKPAAGVDLLAETRLLKLGRLLAVGDALIRSEGSDAPVARASMTYAIPPEQ